MSENIRKSTRPPVLSERALAGESSVVPRNSTQIENPSVPDAQEGVNKRKTVDGSTNNSIPAVKKAKVVRNNIVKSTLNFFGGKSTQNKVPSASSPSASTSNPPTAPAATLPLPALEPSSPPVIVRATSQDFDFDYDPDDIEGPPEFQAKKKQLKKRHTTVINISEEDEDNDDDDDDGGVAAMEKRARTIAANLEIDRLIPLWRSTIYGFFEERPVYNEGLVREKKRFWHEFKCIATHCVSKGIHGRIVRRYMDTTDAKSTGNLQSHAKVCWGPTILKEASLAVDAEAVRLGLRNAVMIDGSVTAFFKPVGSGKPAYHPTRALTYQEVRIECVKWVAQHMRPFSIVEDGPFLKIAKAGRPSFRIPLRMTVARDTKTVFEKVKKKITFLLQEYDGRLSIATDGWTSPNNKPLIAVTVHFEYKSEAACILLDIVEVSVSHTGKALGRVLSDILDDYGISDKLLSVTCDNASNNDTMILAMSKIISNFGGEKQRVRCFAHIVNLVVKIILRQFDSRVKRPKRADVVPKDTESDYPDDDMPGLSEVESDEDEEEDDDDDDDDDDSPTKGGSTTDGKDDIYGIEELEAALEEEIKRVGLESRPLRQALTKLREIAKAILISPTKLKPAWEAIVKAIVASDEGKAAGLTMRYMPRDVPTRWNSTYDMIVFALRYRIAIDKLTGQRDYGMRDYELSEDEWSIVDQLGDCLKSFKMVTLAFSRDAPSLPSVIPAIDKLDQQLTSAITSSKYDIAIKSALSLGKKLLNKYYSMTDHSDVYRISMVLHPRYKLRYFEKADWSPEWIQTAKDIVRAEFQQHYASYEPPAEKPKAKPSTTSTTEAEFRHFLGESEESSEEEDSISDELDRYLAGKTVKVDDAMKWWHENRKEYPRLFRMARDYLHIPATSVAVERVFSRGRLTMSFIRNRLSAESSRSLLCLGAWSRMGWVNENYYIEAASIPDNTEPLVIDRD